ncbi:MAG: Gfo/Idh/MocA family protein, partial [Vicinamibacteraceae bacterium]
MSGKRQRPRMRPSRRALLKSMTMAGAGLAMARPVQTTGQAAAARKAGQTSMIGVRFERRPTVRLGLIGVGARGGGMLDNWLAIDGVEIKAICDVVADKAREAGASVEKKGFKAPELYTTGERDYERMCTRDDLDAVYIATPWDWHVPMAVAAMKNGIHAAVEVPAAETLEECWTLVDTSEQTRRHCIMLENCCYGRSELLVLNMVKAGLFGDLLHGGAGYVHD